MLDRIARTNGIYVCLVIDYSEEFQSNLRAFEGDSLDGAFIQREVGGHDIYQDTKTELLLLIVTLTEVLISLAAGQREQTS